MIYIWNHSIVKNSPFLAMSAGCLTLLNLMSRMLLFLRILAKNAVVN